MKNIIYDLCGWNQKIFTYINFMTNNGNLPKFLEFWSDLFFIGNFAVIYLIFLTFFLIKTYLNKDCAYFDNIYYPLVNVGICYGFFGLFFAALKFGINLPRPFCTLPQESFVTIINISKERCLSSFPSAHTGLALLIANIFWRNANFAFKLLLTSNILIVAISRITLAMHYPSDIIYSLFATIFIIYIANITFEFFKDTLIKYFNSMFKKLLKIPSR